MENIPLYYELKSYCTKVSVTAFFMQLLIIHRHSGNNFLKHFFMLALICSKIIAISTRWDFYLFYISNKRS